MTEESALDKGSPNRATSVYVTDRESNVAECLLNGITLLTSRDRLTPPAIMEIDKNGRI